MILVAIVGVDGSGKSTIAQELYTILTSYGFCVMRISEFTPVTSLLSEKLAKRINRLNKLKRELYSDEMTLPRYEYKLLLPLLVLALIHWIGLYLTLFYVIMKAYIKNIDVVLLERYFYDYLMGWFYQVLRISRSRKLELLVFLYTHLSPRPQITIFLDADEKVLWLRKRDIEHHTYVFYLIQRRNYLWYINKYVKRITPRLMMFRTDELSKNHVVSAIIENLLSYLRR